MTNKQAFIKSIAHYKRMIKWAKEQDPEDTPYLSTMKKAIGEIWLSEDCVFCQMHKLPTGLIWCHNCLLGSKKSCCNGLWVDMTVADEWGEWVEKAEKVLKYIIRKQSKFLKEEKNA